MPTTNTQASVPVMQKTKFGHLMDFAGPALIGGVVGGTVGATTGRGGQAAQDFFNHQQEVRLRNAQLQRQTDQTNATIALDRARAVREINRPDFTRGEPIPDDQGGFSARDPRDGTYKHVPGSEQKTLPNSFAPVVTDQGVMVMNHRDGSMAPATIPNPAAVPQTVQVPVHPNDPNNPGPSLPQQVTPNVPAQIPLHPSGYSTPKVSKSHTRNSAGVEQDVLTDDNPNSPTFGQVIKKVPVTRQPVPDRVGDRQADRQSKKDTESSAIEDHVDAVLQTVGNDPDKAVAAITADKNIPSQYKPLMRNRIREIAKRNAPPPTAAESKEEMMEDLKKYLSE
jgi:hypothetical protein